MYKVKSGYTGTNLERLIASPGDFVIVFGSIPGTNCAVTCNTRMKWGGHIPISDLEKEQSQPRIDFSLLICTLPSLSRRFALDLEYNMDDYVRPIREGDGDLKHYGLNVRTLKFGNFENVAMRALD